VLFRAQKSAKKPTTINFTMDKESGVSHWLSSSPLQQRYAQHCEYNWNYPWSSRITVSPLLQHLQRQNAGYVCRALKKTAEK